MVQYKKLKIPPNAWKLIVLLVKFFRFPGTESFCLDPDPYQSSGWIRTRKFFKIQILDLDPYQTIFLG